MKMSNLVSNLAVLMLAGLASAYAGPLAALAVVGLFFAVGSGAVLLLKLVIQSFVPGHTQGTTFNVLDGVLTTLFSGEADSSGTPAMPVFIPASSGRGSDFLRRLYASPQFQLLCRVIGILGPVACYPGCRLLSRQD